MRRTTVVFLGAIAAIMLGGFVALPEAGSQPMRDSKRGELLYETHCIACHTAQVHWREKKLATDWGSLLVQVNRWQGNTGLGWNSEDVADVAQFLNNRYYGYPAGNPVP